MNRVVAAIAAALFAVIGVLTVRVDVLVTLATGDPTPAGWGTAVGGLPLIVAGCLLLWQLPWNRIALILIGFGLFWVLDGLADAWAQYCTVVDPTAPLGPAAFFFVARLGAGLLLGVPALLVLFPDGRLPRHRVIAVLGAVALVLCSLILVGSVIADFDAISEEVTGDETGAMSDPLDQNPFAIDLPPEAWTPLYYATQLSALVGTVLALVVAIARYATGSALQRQQQKWLLWAGAVVAAFLVFGRELPDLWAGWLFTAGLVLISAAILVAVTRYRLYEIDRLLSWTVVYAALIATVLLVDVALVALVGSLIDERTGMLIAVLAVTLLYAPFRDRLFRLASRLVVGRRGDPYGVVSDLAGRLEASSDPVDQLHEVATSIARAFASRSVRVELLRPDGSAIVGQHGEPQPGAIELPLEYRGLPTGRILMEPGRQPRLSSRDRKLLSDLVRLTAAAIVNSELSAELRGIRRGLVVSREEERSRLRSELTVGLSPLIDGMRARLRSSRELLADHPDRSIEVLDGAIADASGVITEIRRLVHDLRPPALDDLGMARALEQSAERLASGGVHVAVSSEVPGSLPAAVEVAAFRIATGALADAARRRDARTVVGRIAAEHGWLVVEVTHDARADGPGFDLAPLRERAVELGGSVAAAWIQGRATMTARIPYTPTEETAHAR